MHNIPNKLIEYTEQLAQSIRHKEKPLNTAARYQQFIRDNIKSVITHTFPEFASRLTTEQKEILVTQFLSEYPAVEPEFHHIATEFVCFIQQQGTITSNLLSLLEYEWVLFSVEIDEQQVVPSAIKLLTTETSLSNQDIIISLNPTLTCVELPFSIDQGTIDFETTLNQHHSYGVFRNTSHQVLYKQLNELDKFMIGSIQQLNTASYQTLQHNCENILPETTLKQWLVNSDNINFISTQPKGD